jgi:hypothetical protein
VKLICRLCLFPALVFVASPLIAAGTSSQPLTRADCEKAGLAWNDNANVCEEAQATPNSDDTEASGQPLTREACDEAGITWNENANVCGSESEASNGPSEAGSEAVAAETPGQPLTRAACDKAGMAWNDNANVCGGAESEASTSSEASWGPVAAETPGQPLTREACDKVGMSWNDSANDCGGSENVVAAPSQETATAQTLATKGDWRGITARMFAVRNQKGRRHTLRPLPQKMQAPRRVPALSRRRHRSKAHNIMLTRKRNTIGIGRDRTRPSLSSVPSDCFAIRTDQPEPLSPPQIPRL